MMNPVTPPDLEAREAGLAAQLALLDPVEPPASLRRAVLEALEAASSTPLIASRRWAWAAAAAVLVGLGVGIVGFARAASDAAACSCSGAECREPQLEVVDDPSMPLYHTLETFTALDRGPSGWDTLADLGGGR